MPQKVLIIDDSDAIHSLVKTRLRQEDLEFCSAHDGISGVSLAASVNPDLILLDVDMPFPDGFEVCRRLKSDARTMTIPIIFLTAASTSEQMVMGLEVGASDYIIKPFEPAELRARVRAMLRTKYLLDLLTHKAMIDGLTGLWNRAYFEQRLAAELSLGRRGGHPLSCVMVDIDHFKSVNDRFGHPVGDRVLHDVAQLLQDGSRTEDVVCRYGGEEFAILTPHVTSAGASELAHRLRAALERLIIMHRGTELAVTCSFGVADVTTSAEPSLVELADEALYRAKHSGRNRVEVATPPPPAQAMCA